jgi:hypothetical protein
MTLFTPGNTCKISHLALDNIDLVYQGNTCKVSHLTVDNTDLVYTRSVLSKAKWDILQVFPRVNKVSVV